METSQKTFKIICVETKTICYIKEVEIVANNAFEAKSNFYHSLKKGRINE